VPEAERPSSLAGRAALPIGILAGLLLIAGLYTQGFGLLAGPPPVAPEDTNAQHEPNGRVRVPDGSPLRDRITVAPVQTEDVAGSLLLPGIVESDPARTQPVLTPLAGRVLELRVALGDRVTAGQVLAVIDSPDLAQAVDDDDKAADTLRLTTKVLQRQQGQFKLGTLSAKDLDQARSDQAQAKAEYTRTEARLRAVGATRGERRLLLRAPTDGSITTLSVARGAVINDVTQPLMTVADLSTVWVTAQVPEKDLAAAQRGQAALIVLDAYPGQLLAGRVQFIADVLAPDTRRAAARIALPNPGTRLKPNMFATVKLLGPPSKRIVVPVGAVLMNNDRTSVFVEVSPWVFERRNVTVDLEEGPNAAIESGLRPGERVAMKGGILLND
jgi:cobalt-zinc-cadmium efflux system membrane fusion protein